LHTFSTNLNKATESQKRRWNSLKFVALIIDFCILTRIYVEQIMWRFVF